VGQRIVKANNRFGFRLFSELVHRSGGKNVFVSPASVAMALAMTYNGASGATKAAMTKALALQGVSREAINRANAALIVNIADSPISDLKVQMSLANALWADRETSFKPAFLKANDDLYAAQVAEIDFRDPGAVKTVNDWVKDNTGGKIGAMADRLDPLGGLYLLSAFYFKGTWREAFERRNTHDGPFTLLNGTQKQVPMMTQEHDFPCYQEESRFQAISLPYGQGRFTM